MIVFKRFAFVIGLLGGSSLVLAEGASWMRSNTANALNPKISVIADFVGKTGTGGDPSQTGDGFHLREVEIGLQAEIDPYARADFFIGGMNDGGAAPELEEGFVTLHSLPFGFQARGGKFRATFGRLNMVHPHELPQVDSPLALDAFLGEGRLTSSGVELSRLFSPFGFFTEATYALLQDLGGEHGHGDSHGDGPTTTLTDDQENVVTVPVFVEEHTPAQRLRNFAQVVKVRGYADLSESANLEWGFSGALHEPQDVVDGNGAVVHDFNRKRLGAVDLTFRWKPLAQGSYRSVLWRTEGLYTDQTLAPLYHPVDGNEESPAARINRRGGYSYVEVQTGKRWRMGVRGDYLEDPEIRSNETPHITRAVAPYVSFSLSEFNRFRVQWTRKDLPGNETENLGYLQWTVVLGPHGAHSF